MTPTAATSGIRPVFLPQVESDTLHLLESAIDLLSFGTLLKIEGIDRRRDNLLSLAGVYKPRNRVENSTLSVALKQYLSDNPYIQRAFLRLDNDRADWLAARTIQTLLSKQGLVSTTRFPPKGKDYNDYLCIRRGLAITRRKERRKER